MLIVGTAIVLASSLMVISIFPSFFDNGHVLNGPASFSLLLPGNVSADLGPRPLLQWEDSEGALNFSLWISTTAGSFTDGDKVVDNSTWTNSYQLEDDLEADTVYHWRVAAINDDGVTFCNGSRQFRTGVMPAAFSLVNPANATYDLHQYLDFVWEYSEGATEYSLYTCDSGEFVEPVLLIDRQSNNRMEFMDSFSIFEVRKTYHWRVVAHNGDWTRNSTQDFTLIREPEPIHMTMAQVIPLNATFNYEELGEGQGRIPVVSEDGTEDNFYAFAGPWGARYSHIEGNAAPKWVGLFDESLFTTEGLGKNENDVDIMGFSEDVIFEKIGMYMAPVDDFRVIDLIYGHRYQDNIYANTEIHVYLDCEATIDGKDFLWHIGHCAYIHDDLYRIIADALDDMDFDDVKDEAELFFNDDDNIGNCLLEHLKLDHVTMSRGDKIAAPHFQGDLVATVNDVNYYAIIGWDDRGDAGDIIEYHPGNAQLEWVGPWYKDDVAERAYYSWFPEDEQEILSSLIANYALDYLDNPVSLGGRSVPYVGKNWVWASEKTMFYKEWFLPGLVENIQSGNGFGFWGEYDGSWKGDSPKRPYDDDSFAIFPVYWTDALVKLVEEDEENMHFYNDHGITPFDIEHLVFKGRATVEGGSYGRLGQVLWSENLEGMNGSMVIHWNPYEGNASDEYHYQAMSFHLLPNERSLIIAWSDEYDTLAEAEANIPMIPTADDVDGGSYEGEWDTQRWSGPGTMRYHNLQDLDGEPRFGRFYYEYSLHVD